MDDTHFYFASTPLHILCFSAVALSFPQKNHVLLLIDQANTVENPYFIALQHWDNSPFSEVFMFGGQNKKIRNRVKSRKRIFTQIHQLADTYKPTQLFTGSDKRLEFQYCASLDLNTHNIYIDEGTYTYIPPSRGKQLNHTLFDTPAKKIAYGNWYKNTPFTAGSSWIDEIWAAFPNATHSGLQEKMIKPFDAKLLDHPSLKAFASSLIAPTGFTLQSLKGINIIFSLPHESLLTQSTHWPKIFNDLNKRGLIFAAKYHPRDKQQDSLAVHRYKNATLIPQTIFFEALLPAIEPNCIIVGDISSILLNTKWLKPKAKSIAVIENTDKTRQPFVQFYREIGITVVAPNELPSLLTAS